MNMLKESRHVFRISNLQLVSHSQQSSIHQTELFIQAIGVNESSHSFIHSWSCWTLNPRISKSNPPTFINHSKKPLLCSAPRTSKNQNKSQLRVINPLSPPGVAGSQSWFSLPPPTPADQFSLLSGSLEFIDFLPRAHDSAQKCPRGAGALL